MKKITILIIGLLALMITNNANGQEAPVSANHVTVYGSYTQCPACDPSTVLITFIYNSSSPDQYYVDVNLNLTNSFPKQKNEPGTAYISVADIAYWEIQEGQQVIDFDGNESINVAFHWVKSPNQEVPHD